MNVARRLAQTHHSVYTYSNNVWMQRAGLDTEKLLLCQPDSGEMALEVVDQTVRSSAVDIICVDSVAALVPRAEIEGEMGAHQGGPCSIPSQSLLACFLVCEIMGPLRFARPSGKLYACEHLDHAVVCLRVLWSWPCCPFIRVTAREALLTRHS